MYWLAGLSLSLTLLAGCDGVGRALIDHRVSKGGSSERCGDSPTCDDQRPAPVVPREAGDFGDFASCVDENPSATHTSDFPRAECDCQSYEVQLQKSSAVPIALDTGRFHRCRLALSAERASTVALQGVVLDDVAISLSGPVDLRLSDAQLSQVRVRANSTSAGEPALSIERSQVSQLAVANDDQDTSLSLFVSLSTVLDSFVAAGSTRFESVLLRESFLAAQDFDASDATISHSVLRLGHALFSASNLNDATIEDCGRVRLVSGDLLRSQIASCREPLQLYSMRVESCLLDGALELDEADVSSSSLGSAQATTVLSYNSLLATVMLCQGVVGLSLSGGLADCVACEGPLSESSVNACSTGADLAPDVSENPCPAFRSLSMCDHLPARQRPH